MIGSSMVLGIATTVNANPWMTGAASAMLESLAKRQPPARTPRSLRARFEAVEGGAGILRIARAPALA